jgi:hypothetical protein
VGSIIPWQELGGISEVTLLNQNRPLLKNRETVLAEAGPLGRAVFQLARVVVDGLEEAAPSRLLYYLPESSEEFMAMESAVIEVIDQVPTHMAILLAAVDENQQNSMPKDLVASYFEGIMSMINPDLERLKGHFSPACPGLDFNLICEGTADLKGKCQSALMAIAAKIVSGDAENSIEVERVLFPEKEEEIKRNRILVESLQEIVLLIRSLGDEIGFKQLIASWLKCGRVDQYALADLLSLQGALGQLMKERSRRALYSGDYRRIRWRERLLSEISDEMHTLHAGTWVTRPGEEEQEVFPRLVQLALEVAAVIDVRLLRSVIGDDSFAQLRALAVTDANAGVHRVVSLQDSMPEEVPEHLASLVQLLQDDDLLTFLELLLGNVLKRASLVTDDYGTSAGGEILSPATETTLSPSETEGRESGGRRLAAEVSSLIDQLQQSDNPRWAAFLKVRDGGPGSPVPPELALEAQQLGWELADRLVPLLANDGPGGNLEEEIAELCARLISRQIGEEGVTLETYEVINEIYRRLEELKASSGPGESAGQ